MYLNQIYPKIHTLENSMINEGRPMKYLLVILVSQFLCMATVQANSKTSGIAVQKTYESYSLEKILSLVEKGDGNAQYDLSERYYYGKGGVPKDQDKAVKWVKLAAAQNISGAQNSLGYYYNNGMGVKRDITKGLHYYKLAADQGHRIAIYNIGYLYMMGKGLTVDTKKAAKLFKKSADLGYIQAKVRLGFVYDEGAGVIQDKEKAFKLYEEAALLGEPNGQFNLASLYYAGEGASKNYSLALMWYTVSSMNGHRGGTRNDVYRYLVNNLTGSEIANAEKLATQCYKSDYKNCAK